MAKINLRTRKPVDQLTPDDFKAFPVWEYADDEEGAEGQDETWVRPVDTALVPKCSYTHVAADFTAACGKRLAGFVTVSTLEGPADVYQGVILDEREYLFVSNPKAYGFQQSRKELLDTLGLTEPEMFPLSFQLRVSVAGQAGFLGGKLP